MKHLLLVVFCGMISHSGGMPILDDLARALHELDGTSMTAYQGLPSVYYTFKNRSFHRGIPFLFMVRHQ